VTRNLTPHQLLNLFDTVFKPGEAEKALTIMVDLPGGAHADTPAWKDRRRMAAEWYTMLQGNLHLVRFSSIACCVYPCVTGNNADLPAALTLVDSCSLNLPSTGTRPATLADILGSSSAVVAMTEFSATAPLKILARTMGFRGATLPGFSREMIDSLLLDYEAIDRRVRVLKALLDRAIGATIRLTARGERHELYLDLRYRTGHASGGLMREPSTVGNLPSGEAYIVPYEGERQGEPSKSEGTLPVQFNDEIVVFDIRGNRATAARGSGPASQAQHRKLIDEPAYGNIAELGIGVLGELGVRAVGSTLLDEKLGLHVAFGRSDHFGGVTGPGLFRNVRNIVHIDWVYVPSVQRDIAVESVRLSFEDGTMHDLFKGQKLVA
jgi:hypothetical protein